MYSNYTIQIYTRKQRYYMSYINNLPLWKEKNNLLSVVLKSPKMNKNIFLGRLIQYDINDGYIQLYLDDQKSLCNLQFDEIDNIYPASLNSCEKVNLKDLLIKKDK